jgi:ATP-dependent Clp protease ATP-binding subunit ClpA
MPYPISLPFYAFRLQFTESISALQPLIDSSSYRIGLSMKALASEFQQILQEKLYAEGDILSIVSNLRQAEFKKDRFSMEFKPNASGDSFPAFLIEFDYFYQPSEFGWLGVLPAMGLKVFVNDLALLQAQLEETVRVDFARNFRLHTVQEVLSTIWYRSIELLEETITLEVLDPGEKPEAQIKSPHPLLDKVALPLSIKRQETFGREAELQQLSSLIQNGYTRNVLLVGPSGVGKTALVWELARQLERQHSKIQIWETTASLLIKELTQERGWEFNLSELCKELSTTTHLLFVRNLLDLFEVGQYQGNDLSMAEFLLPMLSQGQISMIAECTDEQMARIELTSPSYLNQFQILRLEEPKVGIEAIILQKITNIAQAAQVSVVSDAINETILLHQRFLPYSGMPGRPIRFLESIILQKKGEVEKNSTPPSLVLDRNEVIRFFCVDSGMPQFMVDPAIRLDVEQVKISFNQQIFGQEKAVASVIDVLASVKTALTRVGKPIASFLFAGPTGVGKTELAKVLASYVFGSRDRLLRFDMSEFSNPYSIVRLIGAETGSEGLLTSAVRREPFSVLLFDEIEKAHPNFFDLLLQVLGEGRLTDGRGRLANFCSAIIIMTSNVGADRLTQQPIMPGRDANLVDLHLGAVRQHFRPELINRIDQIISFQALDAGLIRAIVEREMQLLQEREGIRYRKVEFKISNEALDLLAKEGFHPKYGGRYLQRAIRELISLPLAKELNQYEPNDKVQVSIKVEDGKLDMVVEVFYTELDELIKELDRLNSADRASALRSKAAQFKEGYYFTLLLQDLDSIEKAQKELPVGKFLDTKLIQQKNKLEVLLQRMVDLTTGIEKLEQDLSLAVLGLQPMDEAQLEQEEVWENDFFTLKEEIYLLANPQFNTCSLHLYGDAAVNMRPLYNQIVEKKGYSYQTLAIWYRDVWYSELVPESAGSENKKPRHAYVYTDWEKRQEPEEKQDIFLGFILKVTGPGARIFFNEEEGLQRWPDHEKRENLGLLLILYIDEVAQDGIHRRVFFRNRTIRRTLMNHQFKDTVWRLNRELEPAGLMPFLYNRLVANYVLNIDREF